MAWRLRPASAPSRPAPRIHALRRGRNGARRAALPALQRHACGCGCGCGKTRDRVDGWL